ncbi:hypothetical protein [Moorena producens]|nr:hypothetical protein [Moorena producens]
MPVSIYCRAGRMPTLLILIRHASKSFPAPDSRLPIPDSRLPTPL